MKIHTRSFLLFVTGRPQGQDGFRLGLTVSRKAGPAVVRNRIKRVVRDYFRLHQHEITWPVDIVVVPKRSLNAKQLDLAGAAEEFSGALRRIGALHQEKSFTERT